MTIYQRKSILNFPGYEIDTNGNVWSCLKKKGLGRGKGITFILSDQWKILKTKKDPNGYLNISLSKNKKCFTKRIHVLLLETFIAPYKSGLHGCHNNGIKIDNRLENLRWDSPSRNSADRKIHGTSNEGENNGMAILSNKQIRIIKWAFYYGCPQNIIARFFNKNIKTIHCIIREKSWKHISINSPKPIHEDDEYDNRKDNELAFISK